MVAHPGEQETGYAREAPCILSRRVERDAGISLALEVLEQRGRELLHFTEKLRRGVPAGPEHLALMSKGPCPLDRRACCVVGTFDELRNLRGRSPNPLDARRAPRHRRRLRDAPGRPLRCPRVGELDEFLS